MPTAAVAGHRVVSREEWLKERIAVLAEEKDLTKRRDALASKVRALPWVKVEKPYVFDGPRGRVSMADLFGSRSQLVVYHFMFDPTWSQGCQSCSFLADHYNGLVVHLAQRDVSFVTVSKAPLDKIDAFRLRMGWTFPWVSGANTDFGRDYGVSFTDEELTGDDAIYNFNRKPYPIRELPGVSVFMKDGRGEVYHTYSVFGRGLEDFLTAYRYIDITPKGRDEEGIGGMGWVRHHDRYDGSRFVVPWAEEPGVTGPGSAKRLATKETPMRGCCAAPKAPDTDVKPGGWMARIRRVGFGLVPIVMLAILPKCPACLAGYVLLFTGIGLSYSGAAKIRSGLIVVSVGGLVWVALRIGRRVARVG